jgi:hypothetical protein
MRIIDRAQQPSFEKDLAIAIATLLIAPTLGLFLTATGLPDIVIQSSVPAAVTVVALVYLRRREKRLVQEELREVGLGSSGVAPGMVALAMAGMIVLLESAIGAVIGSAVGQAIFVTSGGNIDDPRFTSIVEAIVPIYTFILLLIGVIPIGYFASFRLYRRTLAWIAAAVIASRVLRLGVYAALAPSLGLGPVVDVLLSLTLQAPIVFIFAFVGYRIARSRYSTFQLIRAFRELEPTDQQAFLDLLAERKSDDKRPNARPAGRNDGLEAAQEAPAANAPSGLATRNGDLDSVSDKILSMQYRYPIRMVTRYPVLTSLTFGIAWFVVTIVVIALFAPEGNSSAGYILGSLFWVWLLSMVIALTIKAHRWRRQARSRG